MTDSPTPLSLAWRRFRGSDRFGECVRVVLALGGIVASCLARGAITAVIPALLGAIACALAETEDHWRSRLTTLLVTLVCFALTAFAVEWLLPVPLLFGTALTMATFVMVMLGAASGRYATIAGATLILAVYTMIGADAARGSATSLWREPALLLAGSAWYGVLSLLWSALAPQYALRNALARLFDSLADYLDGKAALFTPVHGVDREALQLALALQNEQVVQALNDTRRVLIDRIGTRRPRGTTAARLQLYFMAQDIHERVSSSHYPYDALAEALFHSDVLFRCEHLLRLEARDCWQHAEALRLRTRPPPSQKSHAALADLRQAVVELGRQATPPAGAVQRALDALVRNLGAIQNLLDDSSNHRPSGHARENTLQDPGPTSVREAWHRIRIQLTPASMHFRHALRLSLALLAGYTLMELLHPRHGYWILLTTLLVCQPSYGATRRLLLQRVAGTVLGLVAGWATLQLLPFGGLQMVLIVLTGLGFFVTRQRRYTLATAFITLFVLLCFNQIGSGGYAVMWSRLLDTVIGAGLAALAIHLILPDWRGRRLEQVMADTVHSDAHYLARIIDQYASNRRDDLPYRIARRDAHNASAALSGVLANMLREPGRPHHSREVLLRFLTAAHTLLGHLSSLGSNRQPIADAAASAAVTQAGAAVNTMLEQLAAALAADQDVHLPATVIPLASGLDNETGRLVVAQLALIHAQCERLAALAGELRSR